jgi:hypothetical protein
MRLSSRRSDNQGYQARANQLVAECEELLLGRYPWVLLARGWPVPGWTWMRALAHASAGLVDDAGGKEARRAVAGSPNGSVERRARPSEPRVDHGGRTQWFESRRGPASDDCRCGARAALGRIRYFGTGPESVRSGCSPSTQSVPRQLPPPLIRDECVGVMSVEPDPYC